MAGKTLTSSLIVRLIDQVSAPARKVGAALLGIQDNAKGGFGAGLTAAMEQNEAALSKARAKMLDVVGGLYLMRQALGAPLGAAANFETALEDIGQKAGIPTEKLGALGEQIRKIASDTNQATMSIASAVDSLVGRGAKEDVALAAASPIGKAATAYRAATDDLAAASWSAVDNLKVPADQLSTAIDMMAMAGKEGAFELRDMAQYFPALASQYQGLGQSGVEAVGDLAAALQIVRKGTGDASTAATNLQNVLQKVYANTTVKNFKKLGINIRSEMEKAAEAGMTPIEAIAEITNKALKGDLSKLGAIFEDAQVQAGMRALIQNMDEYRRIRELALGAEGVVDEDFQRRIATAQGAMDRWNSIIQNLNISIGSTLVPLLNSVLDNVLPIVAAIGDWATANPELARTIVAATAGLIGFRIAVSALSFVGLLCRGGALSLLAIGYNTIGKAAIAATEAIRLQSSLAAMSGGKMSGFDKLVTGLRGMAMAVPGVSGLASAIGTLVGAISGPVVLTIGAVATAGVLIWKYWDRLSSIFSGVAKAIGEQLGPAIEPIRPALQWLADVGSLIGGGFQQAWDAIAGFFGSLFSQEKLSEQQKAEMEQVGYKAMMAVLDGMKAFFGSILEWFASWPGQILAAIGSIDLTSLIKVPDIWAMIAGQFGGGLPPSGPGAYHGRLTGPNVPPVSGERAGGGPVWAGSTYRINEKGQEFFSPGRSGTIHPAGSAPRLGGGPISIGPFTFHGISGDPAELERSVRQATSDAIRNLLRGAHSDSAARS